MSDKTLIIAEKPSVAADLAKALPGKFKREKTHFESERYVVSFAVGHLVSICYPEEIDPAFQKWDISALPIIPNEFPLKALDGTKGQLNALQKLIRRKDITTIINACDAGREGELIFKYIVRFVWNKSVAQKSFKRLWLQSMTTEAIRKGFDSLRGDSEMVPLEDTALCRSESDWLIGINATRALTSFNSRRGGFFLTPCGRVQTPTLSLLVKREISRREFTPETYFNLLATFTCEPVSYQGKWIAPNFNKNADNQPAGAKADRLWSVAQAEEIIAKCTGQTAQVEEKSKKSTQSSPPLYDLTLLQREANSRFGFSAQNTLSIAQALYERHKVLTYPRTDSKHLPNDYQKLVKDTFKVQQNWQLGTFARQALDGNYVKTDKRIFNDAKVSDHHAIIPTTTLPATLSDAEMKIYRMVVQRFMAVFFPPAVYLNTRRLSVVAGETFLTEGKILLDAGWRAIYGAEESEGGTLQALPAGSPVDCSQVECEEHQTTPPPRFNEATLLSAMENSDKLIDDEELADAMKERGLGTPATRAAIIEKLIKEKYVIREGKDLAPTGKAFELLAQLEAMKIDVLASPELTGEWEFKLNQILRGEFTRAQFMAEIRELTRQIIDRVRNFESSPKKSLAPFSPVNGITFLSTPTAWVSEDSTWRIRKILSGHILTEEEVINLINGETIGPFCDFRSKKGKPFTASVRLNEKKVEFLFADSVDELNVEEITSTEPLGNSPIDGSPVYITPLAYMSKSALEHDQKNGLRISRIILAKEIGEKHVRQLLSDGKTELISGFISKRRKPFDAYLLMDKDGQIKFEFPPRKARAKNKKN